MSEIEEVEIIKENAHHEYAPSSMKRLKECPASFEFSKLFPELPSHDVRDSGDRLHDVMESGDVTGLSKDELALVDICNDMLERIKEKYGISDEDIHKEVKIKVRSINFKTLTEGTVDIEFVVYDRVVILDWKFGFVKVEAVDNEQLRTYAVGAMQKYGKEKADVYIAQPRFDFLDFESFDLEPSLMKVEEIIENTKMQNNPFYRAGDHCQYCKAKFGCGVQRNFYLEVEKREDLILTQISDEKIYDLYEKQKIVKKYSDSIKNEFIRRVTENENQRLFNYSLVSKMGNREFVNIPDLYFAIKDYMSEKEFIALTSVKVPGVEKNLVEKFRAIGLKVKDAKEKFQEVCGEFIQRKPGKPSVVKDKKKKESVI